MRLNTSLDFWRMLRDIVRFNAAATAYAQNASGLEETLGQYLKRKKMFQMSKPK